MHESVLEKFDNMLDLYAHVYFVSDKKKKAIRDRVLRMPGFDTLEFRVLNGDIQFRQKRDGGWVTLVL